MQHNYKRYQCSNPALKGMLVEGNQVSPIVKLKTVKLRARVTFINNKAIRIPISYSSLNRLIP